MNPAQKIRSAGDVSKVGAGQAIVGELLCEAVRLHAGERVLDVATGAGNTALSAARRTAGEYRSRRWSLVRDQIEARGVRNAAVLDALRDASCPKASARSV